VSRKSKFAGLAGALKDRATAPAPEKRKVAKSQDKEAYAQTTVYLHRQEVYVPLQSALSAAQLEYSQLVEDLLREWLKAREI
jgi:hypothetical protein